MARLDLLALDGTFPGVIAEDAIDVSHYISKELITSEAFENNDVFAAAFVAYSESVYPAKLLLILAILLAE